MDVRAVRIGNRYGPEYEDYLKSKIPNIQFLNENKDGLWYQWNKIHLFNLDVDLPVCVIDIDITLHNDYELMFNYPINRGEFLTIRQHWDSNSASKLNGGFYKFYPQDTKYIYDIMMSDKKKWMNYFIANGTKPGPINGEENFVEKFAELELDIIYLPDTWTTRNTVPPLDANELKMVHYTGLNNKIPEIVH